MIFNSGCLRPQPGRGRLCCIEIPRRLLDADRSAPSASYSESCGPHHDLGIQGSAEGIELADQGLLLQGVGVGPDITRQWGLEGVGGLKGSGLTSPGRGLAAVPWSAVGCSSVNQGLNLIRFVGGQNDCFLEVPDRFIVASSFSGLGAQVLVLFGQLNSNGGNDRALGCQEHDLFCTRPWRHRDLACPMRP